MFAGHDDLLTVSRPVGGVLSPFRTRWPSISAAYLGTAPRSGRATHVPRSALLRVGFTEPAESPRPLVRSYRTVSPLPVRARRPAIGGLLSVALSCESPRLAVSQHPALRSPDLPQLDPAMRSELRPPGRLTVTTNCARSAAMEKQSVNGNQQSQPSQ